MKRKMLMMMGLFVLAAFLAFPAYAQTGAGEEPTRDQSGMQTGEEAGVQGPMAQKPLTASQLMDATVQGQQGNELGSVGDLVLSDTGSIEYIVLAQGGVMGIGSRMVPVPWQQVEQINARDQEIILMVSVDEQKLQDAPSFSRNEWDQLSQTDFEQQVSGYYGEEGEEGSALPGMKEAPGMEQRQPGMEQQPPGMEQRQRGTMEEQGMGTEGENM